jgi:hypothetical protein
MLDFEQDVRIDHMSLDVEWLNQPVLAGKYARYSAEMRRKANQAEQRVKVVRSELVKKTVDDPRGTTGKDKPTAVEVEAYYRNQPIHQEAKQEWIDAEYEAGYAEMAYKEIAFTRKSALENMVRLHAAQYFAGPSVPRDLNKEVLEKHQDLNMNKSIGEAIRRKPKEA